MNVWKAISDYYLVLILLLIVWGLGIWIGSRLGKIKVIYLKNPFKGKSSVIKDESVTGADAMRYKRDYTINLIMADEKDIDYEALSDFTFYVEDLIESGKLDNLKLLNANVKLDDDDSQRQVEKKSLIVDESETNQQSEAVLEMEDIEYLLPNEYVQQ